MHSDLRCEDGEGSIGCGTIGLQYQRRRDTGSIKGDVPVVKVGRSIDAVFMWLEVDLKIIVASGLFQFPGRGWSWEVDNGVCGILESPTASKTVVSVFPIFSSKIFVLNHYWMLNKQCHKLQMVEES